MDVVYVNLPSGTPEPWIRALVKEGVRSGLAPPVDVVYMEGGAPATGAMIPLAQLFGHTPSEWTLRVHEDSVSGASLSAMTQAGVNRLCCVVTEDDTQDLRAVVERARGAGLCSIALELQADLPAVGSSPWNRMLRNAIAAGADHLSLHSSADDAHDEGEFDRLLTADRMLTDAGYERYDLWSYCRPGHACAYTVHCWEAGEYLGLGPGSASHVGVERWTTTADRRAYLAAVERGEHPPREKDLLTPETSAAERLMLGLNLARGVVLTGVRADVERLFSMVGEKRKAFSRRWQQIETVFASLETEGWVAGEGGRHRLTDRGRFMADEVARRIL